MIQQVTCKTCGIPIELLNKISVTVTYTQANRTCDHCGEIKIETYADYFCSPLCSFKGARDEASIGRLFNPTFMRHDIST